jgi:hypothetical protein
LSPRTNLPALGRPSGSNLLAAGPRSNNFDAALPGALVIPGGQVTEARPRSGFHYLWWLYFAGLFGVGFYLVKKVYGEKDAIPANSADGRPRP